jgi:rRNA maturation endonuclease Nob1
VSAEDPTDYGDACSNFRVRCVECGKQVVFENGQRLPDCGHDLPAIGVEM